MCSLFPRPHWYVEILQRGFDGVLSVSSGHLDFLWTSLIRHSYNMALAVLALSMYALHPCFCSDSMSGLLSCHLIFECFLIQLKSLSMTLSRSHMHTRGLAVSQPCRLSAWCQASFHFAPRHLHAVVRMPHRLLQFWQ